MKLLTLLLSRWIKPKQRGAEHVNIILYTRKGCHLCEEAFKLLSQEQKSWRFALQSVDVDGRAELAAQHGDCVPVVMVNGKLRFRGGVNRVLLRRLLCALTR